MGEEISASAGDKGGVVGGGGRYGGVRGGGTGGKDKRGSHVQRQREVGRRN